MATYVELTDYVKLIIDMAVDYTALLRKAENDFIRQTFCTEKVLSIDTSDDDVELTDTYAITDSDLVKVFRVTFDGIPLSMAHKDPGFRLHDNNGDPITGTPSEYWIVDQQIRLIPEPSSNGILRITYSNFNTATDGTSPIIPESEHLFLPDQVIGTLLEREGDENRAMYYLNKYRFNIDRTILKYKARRGSQRRIVDAIGSDFDNITRNSGMKISREGVDGWSPIS